MLRQRDYAEHTLPTHHARGPDAEKGGEDRLAHIQSLTQIRNLSGREGR